MSHKKIKIPAIITKYKKKDSHVQNDIQTNTK